MNREWRVRLLADYCIYLLFAGGVAGVLCRAFPVPFSVPVTLAALTAVFIVFTPLFYNWKSGVAFASALAVAFLVVLRRSGMEAILAFLQLVWDKHLHPFAYWLYLYSWRRTNLQAPYGLWLAGLIWAGAGAFSFAFVRKLPSSLVLAIAAVALFGAMWGLQHYYLLPFAGMAAVAVFAQMTRSALKKREGTPPEARARLQLYALAVAGVMAVCALSAVASDTSAWRATWAERAFGDVNDLLAPYTGFTRPRTTYAIAHSGFQPLGDRLGGPVTLGEGNVLEVYADRPVYLRGAVYSYYTGSGWLDVSHGPDRRIGSVLSREQQAETFDLSRPAPALVPEGLALEGSLYHETEVTVLQKSYGWNTLFTSGRVLAITSPEEGFIPYFAGDAEAYASRPPLLEQVYTVHTRLSLRGSEAFEQAVTALGGGAAPENAGKQAELANYLQLPDGLPESVSQAAKDAAGGGTPYEKAAALEAYLRDSFTYNLQPSVPPQDEDFVAYMLKTGEGYCTYFATAMAVMARCAALPSRYVEGYMPGGTRNAAGGVLVTDANAHAWVEIYLGGIGWVAFDPTPTQALEELLTSGGAGGVEEDPLPEEELPLPDDLPPAQNYEILLTGTPVWVGGGLLALLLLLFIVLPIAHHYRRFRLPYVRRKWASTGDQLAHYYHDLLAILSFYDARMKTGDTALTFAQRVDGWLRPQEGSLGEVAEVWTRYVYGMKEPTAQEIAFAMRLQREQNVALRRTIGVFSFFFQRCLRRACAPVTVHMKRRPRAK